MSDLDRKALKEQWAALIKEREESGLTIKEWCKERNVKESQYYYWLKTLRRDGADAAGQDTGVPPFVELPAIFQEQVLRPGSPAAVIRKGDVSIEITESAPAGLVAKIMEAVAHAW